MLIYILLKPCFNKKEQSENALWVALASGFFKYLWISFWCAWFLIVSCNSLRDENWQYAKLLSHNFSVKFVIYRLLLV